jgi:hypothetical protein
MNKQRKKFDVDTIQKHIVLLGHRGLGMTELRTFDPIPQVAYVDNEDDAIRLAFEMEGKASGIYVGGQPRTPELFDKAPNCWKPASGAKCNCAHDKDIEYITTCFFDIDVVSKERIKGYPASEEELLQSLQAAELISRKDGLAMSSTICCSGNGHYVLAPIVPVSVDSVEIGKKFKRFCQETAKNITSRISGVRIDPVFNLSRVMRLIGTENRKGQAIAGRPYRRAYFVTEPLLIKSMALHYMILNMEVEQSCSTMEPMPKSIRCDLSKLSKCEFIQWCRKYPELVSEPLWWGLITNIAYLEGGIPLIHEISRLDKLRYDYSDTQRVIQRVVEAGYKPVLCRTLASEGMTCPGRGKFQCSNINYCPAKAPMYMATLHTVYKR